MFLPMPGMPPKKANSIPPIPSKVISDSPARVGRSAGRQVGRSAGRQVGRSAGRQVGSGRHPARERSNLMIGLESADRRFPPQGKYGYQHSPLSEYRKFGADSVGGGDFSSGCRRVIHLVLSSVNLFDFFKVFPSASAGPIPQSPPRHPTPSPEPQRTPPPETQKPLSAPVSKG